LNLLFGIVTIDIYRALGSEVLLLYNVLYLPTALLSTNPELDL